MSPLPVAARWTSAAFVLLLTAAVLWPAPVIVVNGWIGGPPLDVDERSFLGREAPSWDVVFWAIAGLLALAVIHTATGDVRAPLRDFKTVLQASWRRIVPELRRIGAAKIGAVVSVSAMAVALVWLFADAELMGTAALIESREARTAIRLSNRFGGGMNPPLVILWFFLAGVAYRQLRWTHLSIAMIFAAAFAGTAVQLLKYVIGRTRPELWLGPFHHAGPPSTSFPSGHTVGAFAIASVILFGSRSITLRVSAMLLATGIGVSRVLAYRHWPSDVLASAILGTLFGLFFIRCVRAAAEQGIQADGNPGSSSTRSA